MSMAVQRLTAALAAQAARRPDHVAMSDETLELTWREVEQRIFMIASRLPQGRLGICGENGCAWALTFIAALLAGCTIVPIPAFFSSQQQDHIRRSAGLNAIVTASSIADSTNHADGQEMNFDGGSQEVHQSSIAPAQFGPQYADDAVIVFTSGSTGQPKGVRLTLENLLTTAAALAQALQVRETDRYLSVLPLPMLLEQICAVLIPVLTGAHTVFDGAIPSKIAIGQTVNLIDAIASKRPSIMVLVPQLLSLLVSQVKGRGDESSVGSLRYIAVGGAAIGPVAVREARDLGLPVFEGYGLTECCSVVALNTPESDCRGSVGKPLPGRNVEIIDGEICVSGPSVMAGYLGEANFAGQYWPTGDVGAIRDDGALVVYGRKDNLIVCSNGRNVSPEWVEATILATRSVRNAIVVPAAGGAGLAALLIADWPEAVWATNVDALAGQMRLALPAYAAPRQYCVISSADCQALELYRMGKPNRQVVKARIQQFPTISTMEWDYETV